MTLPVISNISLDNAHPFRRHPWLYVLVSILAIGIVAVLVFAAWFAFNQQRTPQSRIQPAGPVETPGEKSDRLVMMNILNSFQLSEASKGGVKESQKTKKENVERVVEQLESLDAEESLKPAQSELLSVFRQWDDRLKAGSEDADLKPAFVAIAQKYPWLNTLVWIIILNRL